MTPEDIHNCIASYYDVMEGLIRNATRIKKEMGMVFYADKNGNCTIGNICTGGSCHVYIPSVKRLNPVGVFHVHPSIHDASVLSIHDLYTSLTEKHYFSCVGSEKEGIRCYSPINSPESKHIVRGIKTEMYDYKHVLYPNLLRAAKLLHNMDVFIPSYYTLHIDIKEATHHILSREYITHVQVIDMYVGIVEYFVKLYKNEEIPSRYINDVTSMNNRMADIHKYYIIKSIELRDFLGDNRDKIVQELTVPFP